MNRRINSLLTSLPFLLAGGAISLTTGITPVASHTEISCPNTPTAIDSVPAAETTRNVELEKFGVELTIPSNYRAMLLNNGNVKIVDPGTYKMLVCEETLGRGYARTLVRTVENPNNLTLRQLIQRQEKDPQQISPYTFDGQQGYLVEYGSAIGSQAEFWMDSNNKPGAVVISKACDCEGMKESLVSLLERSSLLTNTQASSQ